MYNDNVIVTFLNKLSRDIQLRCSF